MNLIDEKLKLLKPILGTVKVHRLRQMYLFEDDFRSKKEIENRIDLLIANHVKRTVDDQIILPPPAKEEFKGGIRIGTINYVNANKDFGDFCVEDDDWIRHLGVFGSTGSGKTTIIYNILNQLMNQDKPFLILDWKRDYRDLVLLPEFKNKIMVFTVGRRVSPFHFNPKIKPPAVDEHVWTKHLLDIITHAYLLGPGAEDVLRENMQFETFGEMQEHLLKQRKRARELLWWASAKRTLNAINFPGLSEVVNSMSFDMADLLDKQVILELDGLSDSDKVFLIGSLLMWIYYYRMAQPEREKWKHTIILEEAHHLLVKQSRSQQENYADTLMREIRVFGQSMVLIDQRPSKVSDSAMANVNTKLVMNLNHRSDLSEMSKALLLRKDQENYLGMLKVGQAIIKNHKTSFPFLCDLPDFQINKGCVNDKDVKNHMKMFPLFSSLNQSPFPNRSSIRPLLKSESLSPLGKILLQNIAEKPFIPISKRYKSLGLTNAQGNDAQQELITKEYVNPETIDGLRLLGLTPKAKVAVQKWGILISTYGRGGIEHSYWLNQIKMKLIKEGGFPFTEKDDIDLVADNINNTIAIQIETGKSAILKNAKTLDSFDAESKFMLATNKVAEFKIKSKAMYFPSIQLMHVKDFLKLTKDQITSHQSHLPEISEAAITRQ
jgi:hypothetical protein